MPEIEFGGKTFTVDEDGFIDNFENWAPEWVQFVKKEEGIDELTDEHHKVITVLQDYYRKNPIRYKFYRAGSGRDRFLEKVWGPSAKEPAHKSLDRACNGRGRDDFKQETD